MDRKLENFEQQEALLTMTRPEPKVDVGEGMRWESITGMTDEFWNDELSDNWEPFNKAWFGRNPGFYRLGNTFITNNKMRLQAREDQPHLIHDYLLRTQLEDMNHIIDERNHARPDSKRQLQYRDFSTSFVRSVRSFISY